jgi:hypothetical protein
MQSKQGMANATRKMFSLSLTQKFDSPDSPETMNFCQ